VLASHAAPGLGHLYAPLVTLARAPLAACADPAQALAGPVGGSLAPSRAPARIKREGAQLPASRGGAPADSLGAASVWGGTCSEAQSHHGGGGGGGGGSGGCGGVLTVIETRILVRRRLFCGICSVLLPAVCR
jgi:hypothetical protein